jgi:hypothetical protein
MRSTGGRPARRRMAPAEVEFDVTNESEVRTLLASYDGPVRATDVFLSDQPEPPAYGPVASLGSLSVRRS